MPRVLTAYNPIMTVNAAPTDTATALTSFTALGYCSEDGLTNNISATSDKLKAWGGDTVAAPMTEKKDTFQMKLIECTNADVLAAVFGSGNVSGALETGLTVNVNSIDVPSGCWVIDMILRDNTAKRIVIPDGKISEIGDVVYKDDEAAGYELTLKAMPDTSGQTHYEYIKAAPSGATGATA